MSQKRSIADFFRLRASGPSKKLSPPSFLLPQQKIRRRFRNKKMLSALFQFRLKRLCVASRLTMLARPRQGTWTANVMTFPHRVQQDINLILRQNSPPLMWMSTTQASWTFRNSRQSNPHSQY
ncbi:hypothetical protein MRX96_020287 [Rhipicephalus microplus]